MPCTRCGDPLCEASTIGDDVLCRATQLTHGLVTACMRRLPDGTDVIVGFRREGRHAARGCSLISIPMLRRLVDDANVGRRCSCET